MTGSANCALTRFWSKRLGKTQLRAWQASPRGGDLLCTDEGEQRDAVGTLRALYARRNRGLKRSSHAPLVLGEDGH